MRKLGALIRQKIESKDDEWVQKARQLTSSLKEDKRGQLRNVLNIAEQGESWKALELFINYQAARNQLPKEWANKAIELLRNLEDEARSLLAKTGQMEYFRAVHMELVSRVLGYAVRWHVYDMEGGKSAS
jgi:hypothetical protein